MKAIPLVIATVIILTGCGMADSETVVPGVAPDTSEINFGLIPGGLPSGFYDDGAIRKPLFQDDVRELSRYP